MCLRYKSLFLLSKFDGKQFCDQCTDSRTLNKLLMWSPTRSTVTLFIRGSYMIYRYIFVTCRLISGTLWTPCSNICTACKVAYIKIIDDFVSWTTTAGGPLFHIVPALQQVIATYGLVWIPTYTCLTLETLKTSWSVFHLLHWRSAMWLFMLSHLNVWWHALSGLAPRLHKCIGFLPICGVSLCRLCE